jgi:hypothetical protein
MAEYRELKKKKKKGTYSWHHCEAALGYRKKRKKLPQLPSTVSPLAKEMPWDLYASVRKG